MYAIKAILKTSYKSKPIFPVRIYTFVKLINLEPL